MVQLGLWDLVKVDCEARNRVLCIANEKDGEQRHQIRIFQNGVRLLWPAEWVILQVFASASDAGEQPG
jgi:hypothetical protein